MFWKRPLYCLALLIIICKVASAQGPAMLHYTIENGLPGNKIYVIFRDSKGFLWIATNKGLVKYDGLKFVTYTISNGLPDNEILCINEDHQQRVWLGCYNGNLCYYKNDTFFTAKNKSFLKLPYQTSFIRQITIEQDSSVLIAFFNAYRFVEIKNETCKSYDLESESKKWGVPVASIVKTKVAPDLYKIYEVDTVVLVDTNGKIQKKEKSAHRVSVFMIVQGKVYLSDFSNYYTLDGKLVWQQPEDKNIHSFYTNDEHIFRVTPDGVFTEDSLLIPGHFTCITQDIVGNYWIGSFANGIYCIGKDLKRTAVISNAYKEDVIFTRADSTGLYFALNNKGLLHMKGGKITPIISEGFLEKNQINPKALTAHIIDDDGAYYGFYNKHLLYIKNIRASKPSIEIYPLSSKADGYKEAFNANNNIYVLRYNHMFVQPKITNGIIRPGHIFQNPNERIYCMTTDTKGTIWYATKQNLYKLENEKSIIQKQFGNLTFRKFIFLNNYLIGYTQENELAICNNVEGKIQVKYIHKENFAWENFYPIDTHRVLISTDKNYRILSLLPSDSTPAYNLHVLENPLLPFSAEMATSDGTTCYFFKNGHITSIGVDNLFIELAPPKIYFSIIQTLSGSFAITNNVTIPYNASRVLNVFFSAVSFSDRQIRYQYSISQAGAAEWVDLEEDKISLVELADGDYTIMLRASTASGIFCPPISFHLHIQTPYWLSWWFICIIALAAAFLFLLVIIFTRRLVLRANEQKNLRMELELKAIYSQINPHFIFNTLNSALTMVRKNRMEEVYDHISQFSRLLRSYIRSSRNKLISIADEVANLTDYLELQRTRFAHKFEYTITVAADLQPERIKIPSLLLQPFVENAVNHGLTPKEGPGHLYISFSHHGHKNNILCRIEDDGIGRKQAAINNTGNSESYGDLMIKDLVSIFNKYEQMHIHIEYVDKETPHTGTIVLINIKDPHYEQ